MLGQCLHPASLLQVSGSSTCTGSSSEQSYRNKPNSKCWTTCLGNPGLCLELMLLPGKASPTFLRWMSWGVMWLPKAEEAMPGSARSVLLILALDAAAGRVASFNGTYVPRNSGNCRSLPTQGMELMGETEHRSQTRTALGWVASLSLSYPFWWDSFCLGKAAVSGEMVLALRMALGIAHPCSCSLSWAVGAWWGK